jgi:hypothetical protein
MGHAQRVCQGIGADVQGDKIIFPKYFARMDSAHPVPDASSSHLKLRSVVCCVQDGISVFLLAQKWFVMRSWLMAQINAAFHCAPRASAARPYNTPSCCARNDGMVGGRADVFAGTNRVRPEQAAQRRNLAVVRFDAKHHT